MGGPPQGPWSFPGVPWCPRVLEKISKIPKNYIKNIHAKKYPKIYSQHPFWGTWMPWGGLGGSKSSEGLRRGFFAPNRKVQKPNIVCIYPINNSPVVKIENFEISTLSPPPTTEDVRCKGRRYFFEENLFKVRLSESSIPPHSESYNVRISESSHYC